jgi:mannose-1-phosphate guanylyltransferase
MKAMILAAGYGTRLRPLTLQIPKVLIPIANRPLMERNIAYLKKHGFDEIIVNAHHHHEQLIRYLGDGRPFGVNIKIKIEPKILGTGGGIGNTTGFWDETSFIVINGDILTDIDLSEVYETHMERQNLVTLVLHDYLPFNMIQIDDHMKIIDIPANFPSDQYDRLAFTGIHVIEPRLLDRIPGNNFSNIIDCYRELISRKEAIGAYIPKGHYWRDIGTIESYVLANTEALQPESFLIGAGSDMHETTRLKDWAVVGKNAQLGEDVEVSRSILWENVSIMKGTRVTDSIVTANRVVDHDLNKQIL